ncbi:hypothetical protein PanWU01x14_103920 [Parasponia andersonii]|uniref:Uncharacterized protein n=1 Tax=Parasponia andersonii TaxID=3476 RepID=A0A2P5D1R2_PARAD|nr:hypothetical protein PanWU01x14_103920 [Parasponia andersonii]
MLRFENCFLFNAKPVTVMNWCQEQHWVNVKFAGRNRWVRGEGILLDWWSIKALQDIREKLGGLICTSRETVDCNFIRYAKL